MDLCEKFQIESIKITLRMVSTVYDIYYYLFISHVNASDAWLWNEKQRQRFSETRKYLKQIELLF